MSPESPTPVLPIAASLILPANNKKNKPRKQSQYEGESFHWAPRLVIRKENPGVRNFRRFFVLLPRIYARFYPRYFWGPAFSIS